MNFENRNYAFAGAFVDELARGGLRHVCICPGSRSSPLTISFARHSGIKKWIHLDERSAAFFALGIARRLDEPVAIVCSSGTAAANFLPAVVEASYSYAPLLLLTADRPPELTGWGALQTIDQVRIYSSHARWSVNMPLPEATPEMTAYVRSMAGRALAAALGTPAGPVHLNFPFREPLEPKEVTSDSAENIETGRVGDKPYLISPKQQASVNVQALAEELARTEKGLIICGPDVDSDPGEVVALAKRLGYPVLADCLSQVRCGPHELDAVIDCYDLFIDSVEAVGLPAPDVVIRFGALPVSKPLTAYLQRHRDARHVLVSDGPRWQDPFFLTGEYYQNGRAEFCHDVRVCLGDKNPGGDWLESWNKTAHTVLATVSRELNTFDAMFEGRVFSELAALLPAGALLFAGNSMPVRDMDSFFPSLNKPLRFMANRGASGLDGVTSTALGAAAVHPGKTVLVLGDISFYHDMNGLLAAGKFGLDATIIVINNNGGGIFSFLPQAAYEEVFEDYFGTPHGLTFKAAAELYGLDYRLAGDWTAFRTAVEQSLNEKGTMIIEVPGERKTNYAEHRRIRETIAAEIRRAGGSDDA